MVLYNWRAWLHQMVEYAQKPITYYNKRLDGNRICHDERIISPKTLKGNIFPTRLRKAGLLRGWDVEKGTEKAKAG